MNFEYIEDLELRKHATILWNEAVFAKEAKLWNATGALSGAVVEVILIAIFEQLGDYPSDIDKITLGGLITRLKDKHKAVIPDHIFSTAQAVKDYRNLFHPGRARQVGIIGQEEAEAVFFQAQVMLKWLFEWTGRKFKYKAIALAEQVVMMDPYFRPETIIAYREMMTKNEWESLPKVLQSKISSLKDKMRASLVIGGGGPGNLPKLVDKIQDALDVLGNTSQ